MKGRITKIKETCLYVNNLDKTQTFYHEILGFPIISRKNGRHIFFKVGTSVLLCFIADVTKNERMLPPHFAYGKQHLAFETSLADLNICKTALEKAQIPITHVQEWKNGLESFYFEDYEGNILELVPPGIWE